MEPRDPARAAGGKACSRSQVGPRGTLARARADPSRPAETWLRAGRLARELRSRARRACGREEDGPGRCSGTGAGRWECEGTATSALTTPAAASRRGKKLCLEERFAREPARAQLSRRPRRAWTGGARGHGGARSLGAAPCARYSPWGPPCGHPRGAWSVACGSRRPQTSAASLIWAAFLWAAQRSGVRAGGGGRGRGKTTSRMG